MKISKLLLAFVPAVILASCSKYDDSSIWEELNSQESQISSLLSRVAALESNVSALQSLVDALSNSKTISNVVSTSNGYTIYFSDGTTASITNGSDGKEGSTPLIGIAQDTDGSWYWTINGSPLTYPDGSKVKVSYDDSQASPQFKIEDGKWYISYNNGASWAEIPVSGESSSATFKSVTTDADYAYFTLADGTVITIPLSQSGVKLQLVFDESAFARMTGGETLSTTYEIKAAADATVSLETWESEGWTVNVTETTSRSGSISITAPTAVKSTKILFALTDDKGGSFVKIIRIEPDRSRIVTSYTVDASAGDLVIPVTDTNVTISESGSSWLSVKSSGDSLVLHFLANVTYEARSAEVTLEDGTTIMVSQVQNDAIVLSGTSVEISGSAQVVPVVLSANVTVTAVVESGVTWVTLPVATKALESKTFTLDVSRNGTGAQRSASVVFSGGSVSETVTVVQDAATSDPVPATITGVVMNSSTGQPYSGVQVTCSGQTVTTGSDGSYTFSVPDIGGYTLTFQATDGQTYSTTVSASDFKDAVATVAAVVLGTDEVFPTLTWQDLAKAQVWYHNDYRGKSTLFGEMADWTDSYLSAMPKVGVFRCEDQGYAPVVYPKDGGMTDEGDTLTLNGFLYGRKRISAGNKILSVYVRTFPDGSAADQNTYFGLQALDMTAGATKAVKVGQTCSHNGGYSTFTFDLGDFVGHEIAFAFGVYFATGTKYNQLPISRMCFASEAVTSESAYLPGTSAPGLTEGWKMTLENLSSLTPNDGTSFTGLPLGLVSGDGENGARRTHNPGGQQGYNLWVGTNHLMTSWAYMYLKTGAQPVNSEGYTIRIGTHTGADYDTPESYIYSKFHVTDSNDEMTMRVRTFSYTPTVFKVTAITDSGEAATVEPSSYQLPSTANSQESASKVEDGKGCWQLALQRGTSSAPDNYATFTYDLSSYNGKDVVIAIGVYQGDAEVNYLQLCFYSIEMK